MHLPDTSTALLEQANNELLLQQMIKQLNKDFQLANIDTTFAIELTPIELKEKLLAVLLRLVSHEYDDYLNLLYRIDVAEKDLLGIGGELEDSIEQVTLVVLKRIYKKVWFRNRL